MARPHKHTDIDSFGLCQPDRLPFEINSQLAGWVNKEVFNFTTTRYIKWDRKEVAQDCLIRLWQKADRFDSSQIRTLRGWVKIVCSNCMRNIIRKKCRDYKRKGMTPIDWIPEESYLLSEKIWENTGRPRGPLIFDPPLTDRERLVFGLLKAGFKQEEAIIGTGTSRRTLCKDLIQIRKKYKKNKGI